MQLNGPALYTKIALQSPEAPECRAAIDEGDDDPHEDDSEAIVRVKSNHASVKYNITYSTSYAVPVLSVSIADPVRGPQSSVERLCDLLVPETSRSQLKAGGVLGMLSLTELDSGELAYQIHPCRTQEVMQKLIGDRSCSPLRYMMLWLGTMGPSIGLTLPQWLCLKLQSKLESESENDWHL